MRLELAAIALVAMLVLPIASAAQDNPPPVPPENAMKLSAIIATIEQRDSFHYVSEVDWDTIVVDAPAIDRDSFRRAIHAISDGAGNGWMGRQLRRYFLDLGLEQVSCEGYALILTDAPTVLDETWCTRKRPDLLFAGQVSGVEGYVESAASGLIAGRNAARDHGIRDDLAFRQLGPRCHAAAHDRPVEKPFAP